MMTNATLPTENHVTRITKGGRKLTYVLTVIQQPQRARACGSGAKSSADRRPVDPPPVVELKIWDEQGSAREDVTVAYEANFFLFATLEAAHPQSRGRLPQATAPPVPVLTGMPVSGMAYLDRPTEAGYFIFPDLSVRHEGTYVLSFNLYEETRHDDDRDADHHHMQPPSMATGAGVPDASFDWRMEVKSREFLVYSAKKFPGLTESTALSRTVAEQGCRVRIRRDVRMRRRDQKGGNGAEYDEQTGEEYTRERPEEQSYQERTRSLNGSPSGPQSPYSEGVSSDFVAPNRHQFPGQPQATPPSFLAFGGTQYTAAPQSQFAQTSLSFQPLPQNFSTNAPYRAPPPPPPPPPPPASLTSAATQQSDHYKKQYPQPVYSLNPLRELREYQHDHRRFEPSSMQQQSQQNSIGESPVTRPHHAGYQSSTPHSSLLRIKAPEHTFENASSSTGPLAPLHRIVPPLSSSSIDLNLRGPYSQISAPSDSRNGKRPFDHAFSASASAINDRLVYGQRPHSPPSNSLKDDDDPQLSDGPMIYKRADGQTNARSIYILN